MKLKTREEVNFSFCSAFCVHYKIDKKIKTDGHEPKLNYLITVQKSGD